MGNPESEESRVFIRYSYPRVSDAAYYDWDDVTAQTWLVYGMVFDWTISTFESAAWVTCQN
jgi:hypothetical protein